MNRSRRRAALSRAVGSAARNCAYSCEPLERRVLLSGNDPVIVLTEAFSLTTFVDPPNPVTSQTVHPRLWKNPLEFHWDLDLGN